MPLFDELKTTLEAYVAGRIPLSALRRWLAEHVQDVADREAPIVDDLEGLAWLLLSEYDYGHIDEERLRAGLRQRMAELAGPQASESHEHGQRAGSLVEASSSP